MRQRGIETVVIAARAPATMPGAMPVPARLGQPPGGGPGTPSLYSIYHQPPRLGNALVLGSSPELQKPDIVAVLQEARQQGALTAAITNSPGSDLAQEASHIITCTRVGSRLLPPPRRTPASCCHRCSAPAIARRKPAGEVRKIPQVAAATLTMEAQVAQAVQRYRTCANA